MSHTFFETSSAFGERPVYQGAFFLSYKTVTPPESSCKHPLHARSMSG